MREKIRIVLADDHAVLRAGLRLLIGRQADMDVVGEASDGRETLAQVSKVRPDVVLFDLTMPETDGIATIPRIVRASPGTRVLVLTMHADPAYVEASLAAGAAGFLAKKAGDVEVLAAIRDVAAGSASIGARRFGVVRALDTIGPHGSSRTRRSIPLSGRETEVLKLLGRGHTHREMAERLRISEKTVETYRARLSEKLRLHGRSDLVRFAIQTGLLARASRHGRKKSGGRG